MMKLGTPVAVEGPGSASVKVGLLGVGAPPESRSGWGAGCGFGLTLTLGRGLGLAAFGCLTLWWSPDDYWRSPWPALGFFSTLGSGWGVGGGAVGVVSSG